MAGAAPPLAAALAAVSAAVGGPYEALRVRRAATQAEIKAAYRAMAKRLHPDASCRVDGGGGSSSAAFMEIRRAYETLSDPAERACYDRSFGGARWRRAGGAGATRVRRWETDQCW